MLRGEQVRCPCCDSTFRVLRPLHGRNRVCWACGSLERQRLVALHLDRHPELLAGVGSVLHVAPEPSLSRRLRSLPGVRYVGGDLTAEYGPELVDVTAIAHPDDSFDVVVCNHVLEHVPDDGLAMRELRRVLRPGGWALLLVPDLELGIERTDEAPDIDDPQEQARRFGQLDHVRRYGQDYYERLRAAGFDVEVVDSAGELSPEEIARCRLAKRGRIEPLVFGR